MVILLTSHETFIFTIFSFPIIVIAILIKIPISPSLHTDTSQDPTLDQNVQNTTLMQSHKHTEPHPWMFRMNQLHLQVFIYYNYCISFF